jgi:two-component system, OmpR family, alkaline phosphatase synthesis response regulator PhoP
MGEARTILVVDDEAAITSALTVLFEQAGYQVLVARSGAEALALLDNRPDLIVLDIMMPGVDGYEVARRVRGRSEYMPIVMLTAKDQSWEKVVGLERGADAYLTKPFAPGELLAQVRALLRLVESREGPGDEQPLTCGPLQLWPAQRRVTVQGKEVELTPKEYELLAYLMQRPGQAVGRETLLRQVWGYDEVVDSRAVDTHISRLRAKIEADPSAPTLLQTVRGFGYRLSAC